MEGDIYLTAAYAVFWTLTFVLILSIWVRQRRLERKISALKAQLADEAEKAD